MLVDASRDSVRRSDRSRPILCAFVFTLSLWLGGCDRRDRPGTALALEQVTASVLPGIPVTTIVNDGKGRFLAWSRTTGTIALFEGGVWRTQALPVDVRAVLGAGFDPDGKIQLVYEVTDFASGRGTAYLGALDRLSEQTEIPVTTPGRVVQAAMVDDNWYLAAIVESNALVVLRRSSSGEVREVWRIAGKPGRAPAPRWQMTPQGEGLLITRVDSPFTVQRIDSGGRLRTTATPVANQRVRAVLAGVTKGIWNSLPAVRLDDGYLQTLTDLRSENRVVVVAARDGNVLSVSPLKAPLGFVDSDTRARQVCAVRTLNVRELICYRWHRKTWRTLWR